MGPLDKCYDEDIYIEVKYPLGNVIQIVIINNSSETIKMVNLKNAIPLNFDFKKVNYGSKFGQDIYLFYRPLRSGMSFTLEMRGVVKGPRVEYSPILEYEVSGQLCTKQVSMLFPPVNFDFEEVKKEETDVEEVKKYIDCDFSLSLERVVAGSDRVTVKFKIFNGWRKDVTCLKVVDAVPEVIATEVSVEKFRNIGTNVIMNYVVKPGEYLEFSLSFKTRSDFRGEFRYSPTLQCTVNDKLFTLSFPEKTIFFE